MHSINLTRSSTSWSAVTCKPKITCAVKRMTTINTQTSITGSTVFITCKIPKIALDQVKSTCKIVDHWDSEAPIPRDVLLKGAKYAQGLLCMLENKIDKELLSNSPNLKVVSTISVGFDHVDVKECTSRSIKVGNTPGILTETTADLTLALLLATARRIPEGVEAVKGGSWTNWKLEWMCGRDVHNSTVGIVGLGRIGEAVAKRLKGFNCRVLYSGSSEKKEAAARVGAEYVDFDTLLRESDFVSAHCPLNQDTKNLFNAQVFNKMKPTSVFINTTRGGVVDQDALYDALKDGKIWAAGLDVTSPEPLPTGHKLLSLKNCVTLPHIGSATVNTRTQMAMIAVDNLIRGLKGEKLMHQVNQ